MFDVRDYSLYLTEFSRFVELIVASGRIPDETDVDTFVEKMWTRKYWAYDENNYSGASTFKGVAGFFSHWRDLYFSSFYFASSSLSSLSFSLVVRLRLKMIGVIS